MLIINGHKFAKNNRNFVNTLFEKDGTAYGYYKKRKHSIILQTMGMETFAAIVKTPHFCGIVNARESGGKVFFQYAASATVEKLLGVPERCLEHKEYAENIFNNVN